MLNKIIAVAYFLCMSSFARAQAFMTDVNGRPISEIKYTDIEGSAYLNDTWSIGEVKAPNGKSYPFAKVRFDANKNELEYEKDSKLYRFSTEIVEFVCSDGVFRRNFPAVDSQTERHFYNVLYDGKIKLLEFTSVKIITERPYNAATNTKRFQHEHTFYLSVNGQMNRVKKDKKSLLALLKDKESLLEKYIKDNKIKFSTAQDMIRVVDFYENN